MKPLFIIDTYPSHEVHLKILNRCIYSIKANGGDVLIVSHLPIPKETYEKANYFIYDFNNTFLLPEYTPFYWLDYPTFDLKIYNGGHTLPICRNMKSSVTFAKAMGYQHFIFLEYDVVLSSKDFKLLDNLMYKMDVLGKKMLFFKPEEYRGTENSYVYETLLFGGNTNFFIDNFNPPIDLKEWVSMNMGYTLEQAFFEKLGHLEDQFLIINEHSSQTFSSSEVNLMRYGLFNCEVIHNELSENEPILFIINSLIEETPKYGDIYVNDKLIHSHTFYKNVFWFNAFKFDGSVIEVIIYNDEEKQSILMKKRFELLLINKVYFKNKGYIKFKTN